MATSKPKRSSSTTRILRSQTRLRTLRSRTVMLSNGVKLSNNNNVKSVKIRKKKKISRNGKRDKQNIKRKSVSANGDGSCGNWRAKRRSIVDEAMYTACWTLRAYRQYRDGCTFGVIQNWINLHYKIHELKPQLKQCLFDAIANGEVLRCVVSSVGVNDQFKVNQGHARYRHFRPPSFALAEYYTLMLEEGKNMKNLHQRGRGRPRKDDQNKDQMFSSFFRKPISSKVMVLSAIASLPWQDFSGKRRQYCGCTWMEIKKWIVNHFKIKDIRHTFIYIRRFMRQALEKGDIIQILQDNGFNHNRPNGNTFHGLFRLTDGRSIVPRYCHNVNSSDTENYSFEIDDDDEEEQELKRNFKKKNSKNQKTPKVRVNMKRKKCQKGLKKLVKIPNQNESKRIKIDKQIETQEQRTTAAITTTTISQVAPMQCPIQSRQSSFQQQQQQPNKLLLMKHWTTEMEPIINGVDDDNGNVDIDKTRHDNINQQQQQCDELMMMFEHNNSDDESNSFFDSSTSSDVLPFIVDRRHIDEFDSLDDD